jgi:hypothetical protein
MVDQGCGPGVTSATGKAATLRAVLRLSRWRTQMNSTANSQHGHHHVTRNQGAGDHYLHLAHRVRGYKDHRHEGDDEKTNQCQNGIVTNQTS